MGRKLCTPRMQYWLLLLVNAVFCLADAVEGAPIKRDDSKAFYKMNEMTSHKNKLRKEFELKKISHDLAKSKDENHKNDSFFVELDKDFDFSPETLRRIRTHVRQFVIASIKNAEKIYMLVREAQKKNLSFGKDYISTLYFMKKRKNDSAY